MFGDGGAVLPHVAGHISQALALTQAMRGARGDGERGGEEERGRGSTGGGREAGREGGRDKCPVTHIVVSCHASLTSSCPAIPHSFTHVVMPCQVLGR